MEQGFIEAAFTHRLIKVPDTQVDETGCFSSLVFMTECQNRGDVLLKGRIVLVVAVKRDIDLFDTGVKECIKALFF